MKKYKKELEKIGVLDVKLGLTHITDCEVFFKGKTDKSDIYVRIRSLSKLKSKETVLSLLNKKNVSFMSVENVGDKTTVYTYNNGNVYIDILPF